MGDASDNMKMIILAVFKLNTSLDRARLLVLGTLIGVFETYFRTSVERFYRNTGSFRLKYSSNVMVKNKSFEFYFHIIGPIENVIIPLDGADRAVLGTQLVHLEQVPRRIWVVFTGI